MTPVERLQEIVGRFACTWHGGALQIDFAPGVGPVPHSELAITAPAVAAPAWLLHACTKIIAYPCLHGRLAGIRLAVAVLGEEFGTACLAAILIYTDLRIRRLIKQ